MPVRISMPAALTLGVALTLSSVAATPRALTPDVRYWPSGDVSASFAKGGVLIETGGYKVHTSRRTTPGKVEIHTRDTDIIYVQEGSATFVLGGTLKDGQETGPEEIRGTVLEGGEPRVITKGDVIIVPNGVAHWFKEVQGPVLYYTVKVRAEGGDGR